MYWYSRQQKQRLLKSKSQPSESTPFSSVNIKTDRPKEITLFPIVPNLVQTDSSDTSSTNSSIKSRQQNLLQR
jgi:hypothetical protein